MKTKLLLLLLSISLFGYSQDWTVKDSGFTDESAGINQFYIVDSNVVWATAYDGSAAGANYQKFTKSTDGGETWTVGAINLGNAALSISNICAIDENTAWVAAYASTAFDRGGIWKTTDGGATWAKQASALYNDGASFTNVVHFWDANNGFCQGDPIGGFYELYTTTNGGTTWSRIPSASIPAPLTGEYGYVRQIEVVGDRMWWTTNKGRIYRSDDHGLTFVVYQSPIADFGGAADGTGNGNISFTDENNGILVTSANTIFKTIDGGATWQGVTTSGTFKTGDVSFIPGTQNVMTVSGATDAMGSSYSTDAGTTWTEIDNDVQHIGVEFAHGLGFTGGFTTATRTVGGMFKYSGDLLSTKNNTISTFKAYPNPVKNILTIEGNDTITNVSIFNMLGQKVLETTPNQNSTTINMNSLNSGSYFAKVTINGATETMKIIK